VKTSYWASEGGVVECETGKELYEEKKYYVASNGEN
jgi:hypothetical protein